MGQFNITITAVGPHGCDRKAKAGDKLYGRCQKMNCPDCLAYDFVQMLRQKGMQIDKAEFRHWPGSSSEVVDDLLPAAGGGRLRGQF